MVRGAHVNLFCFNKVYCAPCLEVVYIGVYIGPVRVLLVSFALYYVVLSLHACLDVGDDVTALLWMSLVDFVG